MIRSSTIPVIAFVAWLGLALATPLMAQNAATGKGPPEPLPTSTGLMFRPNHVALRVADLDGSVAWWEKAFGAQLIRRSHVPFDPNIEIAFLLISDDFHIELVGGGTPRQAAPPPADIASDYGVEGYKHIGFMVEDMDRALAHLASVGVKPAYQTDRPDYGVKIALIKDPNGYFIELYAPRS